MTDRQPSPQPGAPEEPENAVERAFRWVKAHPRLVIFLVRIIPVAMLVFGFVTILIIQLRSLGYL